jgi:DNA repair protein RecO (recombination protein O)
MDERATGIILRTRPLTETSLIVHWLTPELGRLATVAKGARRPKSPLRGKLDLFFAGEFSFARSRRSELHTLREVTLHETNEFLRRDLAKLQQAAYAVALVEQTTETDTPVPEIFSLVEKFIAHLHAAAPLLLNIVALEMKLLAAQGLKPDLAEAKLSAGARMILAKILADDFPSLTRLKTSEVQARELRQFLHGFLIYHLGRLPRGREAALTAGA